ncbi:unnamed protein product [Urochloa decumbens]|uniref:Gag1-like clamp domain-containing protein n=1 Tax=Urochloa decumbens TaxID=240449 RepID=A0ABC9FWP0_9POAL
MGGCIGNLSKSQSLQDSKLKGSLIKKSQYSSTGNRRRWQSAAVAWAEMRRQWVGHQAEVLKKTAREPVISWSTTYDDLLSTSAHFPQPIPLSEMVDFLVDIWHEEGLYD